MQSPRVLLFAQHTLASVAPSGVQRVVLETTKALRARVPVYFVKWDKLDGQLRYFDSRDLAKLFGGAMWAGSAMPHPACHRARYRFGDVIEDPGATWLLFPEIPYHQPLGNEILARILSQCREYGVRVATIFYDLIPLKDAAYQEYRRLHTEYVLELLRADLIFPISHFSAQELLDFFETDAGLPDEALRDLRERVQAVPLGESGARAAAGAAEAASQAGPAPLIVMVGAVEPRKQQTRFLKILNDLRQRLPQLARYEIRIFGSLHPACADALAREQRRNPKITYCGYASDAEIEAAWAEAAFSVFLSRIEGFGLPIVESLQHGVPCLTSNFGAMAEVAEPGGCHMIDALSDEAIAEGLIRMATDGGRLAELRSAILRRPKRPWGDYAEDILEHCRRADGRRAMDVGSVRQTVSRALESRLEHHDA